MVTRGNIVINMSRIHVADEALAAQLIRDVKCNDEQSTVEDRQGFNNNFMDKNDQIGYR